MSEHTNTLDRVGIAFDDEEVVHGFDSYIRVSAPAPTQRQDIRIPCRNVEGCIRIEDGSSVKVNLLNIGRGGVCFASHVNFAPWTWVSVAASYIDGAQNLFRQGRIIRVQRRPLGVFPGEYAIQFM